MYKYYLLPDAKKDLDKVSKREKINALDSIERLINGLWGGGTRVKKLHGFTRRKCIYEAREDSGKRLLFTLGKKEESTDTPLYIHNVCIEHDKVIRMAKKIIGDEYNEELYIQEQEEEEVTAIQLLEYEKKYPEQNYISAMIDDIGCFEITEEDVYRFMEQDDVTEEESIAFRLKLSEEQKKIINMPLPKLISGTAGSGKTTVLLYNLMMEPQKKKLYITSNKKLANESKNLFYRLIKGLENESQYKKNTEFRTFEDLLYDGLKKGVRKTMTKERFLREYEVYSRGLGVSKEFEALKVWEEIRSVWKVDINRKSISHEDYLKLTKLEAPNFYGNRDKAFKIYKWYESLLEDNLYFDELDLIKEYLNGEKKSREEYEFVICDEVQDLTELHFKLVFLLTNGKPQNTIIAGDDHQIINHSGFRWEKLKQQYYNEFNIKPELYTLNKNYRCIGNIANLANQVNKLQEKFVEKKYKVQALDSLPYGNKPELLNINEEELIKELKDLGPLRAIIVKDLHKKKELKDSFLFKYNQAPLIFTIEEIKGLEFESVILWNLISSDKDSENKWKKVFRSTRWNANKQLKDFVKYNSSLIYVAITRAMRGCIIYENTDNYIFWNYPDIDKNIKKANFLNTGILGLDEKTTDEEWMLQGINLLNKKHYEAARECFERVKDDKLINERDRYIKIASAQELMDKNLYEQAAEIYQEIDDDENMVKCYDLAGCYEKVYNYYFSRRSKRDNYEKIKEYGIKRFDKQKEWEKSAIYCLQSGLYQEAIDRFEKVGNFKRIAEIYLGKLNNPMQAFKYLKRNGPVSNYYINLLFEKLYVVDLFNLAEGKYVYDREQYGLGVVKAMEGEIVKVKFQDGVMRGFYIYKNIFMMDIVSTNEEKLELLNLLESNFDNFK